MLNVLAVRGATTRAANARLAHRAAAPSPDQGDSGHRERPAPPPVHGQQPAATSGGTRLPPPLETSLSVAPGRGSQIGWQRKSGNRPLEPLKRVDTVAGRVVSLLSSLSTGGVGPCAADRRGNRPCPSWTTPDPRPSSSPADGVVNWSSSQSAGGATWRRHDGGGG